MWAKFLSGLFLISSCWLANELSASEFSRWSDHKHTIRLADDSNSIPERFRHPGQAGGDASAREKINTIRKNETSQAAKAQRYILPLTWEGGRLLVDAKINGRIPVRYIVDTGSNITIIPASFASLLGFHKKNSLSIHIRGIGGVVDGRLIEVESLQVGGAEARNFEMVVVEDGFGATALLGADFLSRFRMEINYSQSQLVLQTGDGMYDGYPAAWWQEKFRLYDRLKRSYEQRLSQNRDYARPAFDESNEYQNYLRILADKLLALQSRADRAALPLIFRQ